MNVSLTSANWQFRCMDDEAWYPAQVPGCVHTDLLRHGKIADPFVGTNERDLQWIDKRDWEYAAEFDLPGEWMAESRIELVFEGLDTYAEVTLNGASLLTADNMFRTWRVDAKPALRESGNRLAVRFRSPTRVGLDLLEAHGYGLPASNDDSVMGGLGDRKISVFTRKAPYHYGWDWGPRFVTSGIWKEVSLNGWSRGRIVDLHIRQDEITAETARVTAVVEIEAEASGQALLTIGADGMQWESEVRLKPGVQTVELPAVIRQPRLWWCRGFGEPALYDFRAELLLEGRTVDTRHVRTGLRSLRLIRQPDAQGSAFHFELNGIPVFAKGANHIPGDSFVTDMNEARYRHEIASAAESNFNMLRVWGGGIYEQDAFYALCDEYGIMVWQDFMFACSMYPGDDAFLDSVRGEAEDNVRRLRNHPCIALWCGNNEIDTAWSNYDENGGWGWKKAYSPEQRASIWADYESLFHRLLPDAVAKLAPGVPYWPSSPMQALTGDVHQHATNDSGRGDIHYWAVWHAKEPFERYNDHVGRFMSEYGFQSFPEYRTVRAYAQEDELALESAVMLHHQKNGRGNQLIRAYAEMYQKPPRDFVSFLYMSQVLQGEAMAMALEAHRRRKPYCMGSLYWQMNDCWPVASWSSMDYYGRWKAVQHYARRSCRDVLVSFEEKDGALAVHVVSDALCTIRGRLSLRLFDFDGRLLREREIPAEIGSNEAVRVAELDPSDWLASCDPEQAVLVAELIGDAGESFGETMRYFVPVKRLRLEDPGIEAIEAEGSGGASFVLTAGKLAKQVVLEAEDEGFFSDNFFDLVPGIPKTVTFFKRGDGDIPFAQAAPGSLRVRSMMDFAE